MELIDESKFINIYELVDPRDNRPRYIGYTKCELAVRLKRHFRAKCNKHKINWLKLLKSQGLSPIPILIERVPNGQHQFWEKYWISQYRTWGFDLLNATEGGDGVEDSTGEIARKIGDKQRGVPNKPPSLETRKKISDFHKGKKKNAGAISKRTETKRLKKLENPNYGLRDKSKPLVFKNKKEDRGYGHKQTEEAKRKISEFWTGKKLPDSQKKNIGLGNKKAWAEGRRKSWSSKDILVIYPDANYVSVYSTARQVKENVPALSKCSTGTISNYCNLNKEINGIKLSYLC